MALLEKFSSEWLLKNISPELAALTAVLFIVGWLAIRISRVINQAHAQEAEQTARIMLLEKQERKLIQLISACPCVSKSNATWLQDQARNGGQPPEKIACVYLVAKEKGQL